MADVAMQPMHTHASGGVVLPYLRTLGKNWRRTGRSRGLPAAMVDRFWAEWRRLEVVQQLLPNVLLLLRRGVLAASSPASSLGLVTAAAASGGPRQREGAH
jgi:hypothetical protein